MINHPFMSEESACFCIVGMSYGSGLKYKANNFSLYIASVHDGLELHLCDGFSQYFSGIRDNL